MAQHLTPRRGTAVTQFSFVDALVAGLYDGAFPASEVLSAGDLGVGCGDALDGELVLLDGTAYLCRGDGQVLPVHPDALLPFAEVVAFAPTFALEVGPLDEKEFESLVEGLVPSNNLFYALRLEGEFDRMTVREATRQQKPFPGLADAVKSQHENTVASTAGTMLGFKGPDVFQGLSVADFHLHYLDAARGFGGHVMDFALTRGTLTMEAYAGFNLRLPQVESYLDAELDDMSADDAIRQAESQ
ncbi:alpha-acetolactate decarboxylase [soil metagenome]